VRHIAGQRNRREILERIVTKLGLHEWIDGERSVRSDEQCVTIGCRARHGLGADAAACTTAIVDDDGLAESTRYPLADDAANDVGVTPGRKRYDQPDRAVGISGKSLARQHRCG
jgi:hypothetical protein